MDDQVRKGSTTASGGTTYGKKGFFPIGKGSGAWLDFGNQGARVGVRVGISYVSLANARANLQAEIPKGTTFASVREQAFQACNSQLGKIAIYGGTPATTGLTCTARGLQGAWRRAKEGKGNGGIQVKLVAPVPFALKSWSSVPQARMAASSHFDTSGCSTGSPQNGRSHCLD